MNLPSKLDGDAVLLICIAFLLVASIISGDKAGCSITINSSATTQPNK